MHLLFSLALAAVLGWSASEPPQQPASQPAGSGACSACHEQVAKTFERSTHNALAAFELRGQAAGCESCHGPGSAHAESGGDATKIRSFSKMTTREKAQACLSCHRQDEAMHWAGSVHASSDVTCTDCHKLHQEPAKTVQPKLADGQVAKPGMLPDNNSLLAKPEVELCLSCHQEQRAKLMAPSHHPVREGRMKCSSCHQPHGSATGDLRTEERVNEMCLSCHPSKQGPFVFEHAPVSENCMTCHDPHGSVANRLLKQNEPFLCMQCHEMHFHSARVSQATPWTLPTGGSQNTLGVTGFMRGYNTKCTVCHAKIHGSDLPSQGVSGRGKALIR